MPRTRKKAHRRIAIAGVGVFLVLAVAAASAVLTAQHHREVAIDRVVAAACRLPTDTAGRLYLQERADAAGAGYVDSLVTMYRRCPRRRIPAGSGTARPSSSSYKNGPRPAPQVAKSTSDEGDDGGDRGD